MSDPTDDLVTYSSEGGVATITINAPEQGNSLNSEMRDQLTEWFEWASADLAVATEARDPDARTGPAGLAARSRHRALRGTQRRLTAARWHKDPTSGTIDE